MVPPTLPDFTNRPEASIADVTRCAVTLKYVTDYDRAKITKYIFA